MSLKLKKLVLVLVCYLLLLAGNAPAGVVRVLCLPILRPVAFSGLLARSRVQLTWRNALRLKTSIGSSLSPPGDRQ
jgi:general secretion pathway protein N